MTASPLPGAPGAAPADARPRPQVASWRFMGVHPLRLIALGFGSGLSPVAPGTAGTLAGWLLFVILDRWLGPLAWGLVLAAGLVVGWWACTQTARALAVADPSAVVWDEILAFWLVLWLVMPVGLVGQLVAFVLFRAFDAIKRGPVGWADGCFKCEPGAAPGWAQGFGIIFDDLVAALCTLVVFAGGKAAWEWLRLPGQTH
jgi:phosphatidylglycerophosphatase A